MESFRDNKTGEITVTARNFTVVVSETGVQIRVGGEIVHSWRPGRQPEEQPARIHPDRKRGSR